MFHIIISYITHLGDLDILKSYYYVGYRHKQTYKALIVPNCFSKLLSSTHYATQTHSKTTINTLGAANTTEIGDLVVKSACQFVLEIQCNYERSPDSLPRCE